MPFLNRKVRPATVRRWARAEFAQVAALRKTARDHELVRVFREGRIEEIHGAVRRLEELRRDWLREAKLWQRLVIDECDSALAAVRVKSCERCGDGFLAKRTDARFCGPACRKASSRDVTDNRRPANTTSTSRGTDMTTEERRDAVRVLQTVADGVLKIYGAESNSIIRDDELADALARWSNEDAA